MSRRGLMALLGGSILSACSARLQPLGPLSDEGGRLTAEAIVAADGLRLPLRVWLPPEGVPTRAVIVALHGFNDYSKAFEQPTAFFAGRGVAVYAYDQRGFGAGRDPGIWAGADAMVDDARLALRLIGAAHPGQKLFLLGESMGGAVAIRVATDPGRPPFDGLILSAPAVWGFQVMSFFPRTALKLAYATIPGWVVTAPPELNIRPSDNVEMLKALWHDPLVIKGSRVDTLYGLTTLMGQALERLPTIQLPTLALYGANEQVLPPGPVAEAKAAFTANPLVTSRHYPDGYHMLLRDKQAAAVLDDIAAWVDGSR